MASIEVNATASLTATGTTVATGSISWTAPSLPEDVTTWDDIVISGTWSWGGKGNITYVNINGTNTSGSVPFSISLGPDATSPISITCKGNNKNATGDSFTWGNLIVTYTYTPAQLMHFKQNGTWVEVSEVYKKVDGTWVLQSDISAVFDTTGNYVNGN